jgi:hypothetical protein
MSKFVLKWLVACGLAAAQGLCLAGDDFIRLVPSGPILPPLAPLKAVNETAMHKNRADFFGTLQPVLVQVGVDKELARLADPALAEAGRVGQAGVLFKTRIAYQQIGTQRFWYPIGNGVSVVGHGPSPEAVVYHYGLNVLEQPVPAGMNLDSELSAYIWVTRQFDQNGTIAAAQYGIDSLESYARTIKASEQAGKGLEAAAKGAYLESYGQMLMRTSQSEQDRMTIQALLRSRTEAAEQLKQTEGELSMRLERAEKAARSAAMWNTLSAVFSVGSSVALASATTGQKIQTPSGASPRTSDELTRALQSLASETKDLARAIQLRAQIQQQALEALQQSLLNQGTLRGKPIRDQDWLMLH